MMMTLMFLMLSNTRFELGGYVTFDDLADADSGLEISTADGGVESVF